MPSLPARLYSLGPAGTFSHRAAERVRAHVVAMAGAGAGDAPTIEHTRTIPEVLSRTEADAEALGVFPIENSDTGTIVFAQDALVQHRVRIEWELNLRVRFALLANAPLEEITTLYSQPVAYDQCGFFLTERLPRAAVHFTNSNTESGERFLAERGGPPCAAIVPAEFGEAHPDARVAEDIQNYENNTTRFLVVRAAAQAAPLDYGRHKTSVLIEPEEDRPGLLYDLLSVFNRHRLNLCRLESRPAKVRPWTYVFFIDFNNNANSAQALSELEYGERKITVLGSFDCID